MSLRDWHIVRQLNPDFLDSVRIAFVFGQEADEALLITSNREIYGVGKNCSGCLGVGIKDSCRRPRRVTGLPDENIEGLACGGDSSKLEIFVVAYTCTGKIYRWGSIPSFSYGCHIIKPVELNTTCLNSKVIALACGYSHCVMLCDDGKVFTWGGNNRGQLGLSRHETHPFDYFEDHFDDDRVEACQVMGILDGKRVIDISCGAKFSVALLDDGKVVTWGDNKYGQLGTLLETPYLNFPKPVLLLNDFKIKKIVCGLAHVLALDEKNTLYGWGNNDSYQLGFSNHSNPAVAPYVCSSPQYRPSGYSNPAVTPYVCSSPQYHSDFSDSAVTHYGSPVDLTEYMQNLRIIDIGALYARDLSAVQCESKEVFIFGKLASGEILSKPTNSRCESMNQVFAYYANMMPKPMRNILEAKRRIKMMDILESEFGNAETSDLTVIVDDNKIHVHQAILKMRSEYFKIMLDRWLKKNEKIVTIKNKSFTAVNTYLKYLYTGKLRADLNSVVELLLLADEYGDNDFKSLCENIMIRDMKADTVAEIFVLTSKLKTCEDLNRFCLDFIINHMTEVFKSPGYGEWDVETMKTVFEKYVENKENN